MQSQDNEQVTTDLRKIRRLIAASMDGVTAEKMRQNGIDYTKNFGVALPRLREIAAMFTADTQLAAELWKTDSREAMIIALMLTPGNSTTVNEAERIAEQLPNNELVEIAATELFAKMPNVAEFVNKMLQHGNKELFVACCTATHAADKLNDTLLEQIATKISQSHLDATTANAVATLFMRLGEVPALTNGVQHATAILKKSTDTLCQRVVDWLSY